MNDADQARVRTYVARFKSFREKQGPLTVMARVRPDSIEKLAISFANAYPSTELTSEEILQIARNRETQHPEWFNSIPKMAAHLRQTHHETVNRKTHVIDLTREVIKNFSPREKLDLANDGLVPSRIVIRGANNGV